MVAGPCGVGGRGGVHLVEVVGHCDDDGCLCFGVHQGGVVLQARGGQVALPAVDPHPQHQVPLLRHAVCQALHASGLHTEPLPQTNWSAQTIQNRLLHTGAVIWRGPLCRGGVRAQENIADV